MHDPAAGVEVATLQCDPLLRTEPGQSREQGNRRERGVKLLGHAFEFNHRLECRDLTAFRLRVRDERRRVLV
jgi:hypothetical protein